MRFTIIDLLILVALAFAVSSGYRRGFWLSLAQYAGLVLGVIIGATLAFLTTILVLDSVAKAETTTVNGWSSIRRAGQPDNGLLVRAALQKASQIVETPRTRLGHMDW